MVNIQTIFEKMIVHNCKYCTDVVRNQRKKMLLKKRAREKLSLLEFILILSTS